MKREDVERQFAHHNPNNAPEPERTVAAYTHVRAKMKEMALWAHDTINNSAELTIALRKLTEANMALNAAIALHHLKPASELEGSDFTILHLVKRFDGGTELQYQLVGDTEKRASVNLAGFTGELSADALAKLLLETSEARNSHANRLAMARVVGDVFPAGVSNEAPTPSEEPASDFACLEIISCSDGSVRLECRLSGDTEDRPLVRLTALGVSGIVAQFEADLLQSTTAPDTPANRMALRDALRAVHFAADAPPLPGVPDSDFTRLEIEQGPHGELTLHYRLLGDTENRPPVRPSDGATPLAGDTVIDSVFQMLKAKATPSNRAVLYRALRDALLIAPLSPKSLPIGADTLSKLVLESFPSEVYPKKSS